MPFENNDENLFEDLFAVDFFNFDKKADQIQQTAKPDTKPRRKPSKIQIQSDWSSNLKKFTHAEVETINYLADFSNIILPDFAVEIIKSLADFLSLDSENIKIKLLGNEIKYVSEFTSEITKPNSYFFFFTNENLVSDSFLVLNTSFLSRIIDLMLGGNGSIGENIKTLTHIETSIVEFLALHLFETVNLQLPKKILRFTESSKTVNAFKDSIFLEYSFELLINETANPVKIYLSRELLECLKEILPVSRKYLLPYSRLCNSGLLIGKSEIAAGMLPFLEKNDIILLEEIFISNDFSNFSEQLIIYLGDGDNFALEGNILLENEQMSFEITQLNVEKFRETKKRGKMNKEITHENDEAEENEEVLENLAVNVKVQFPFQKLTVKEIMNLKVGQVLELGCRPTDLVEVVFDTDGKKIATGNLVEIDGNLGVKLTKIYK